MRGRELDVTESLRFALRVRAEKRAEAQASDAAARGFPPTSFNVPALPSSGELARTRARAANESLVERWQGTAYAPASGVLVQPGNFAYRGALQRSLLPPMRSAPVQAQQTPQPADALAGRQVRPSPLMGYSSAPLEKSLSPHRALPTPMLEPLRATKPGEGLLSAGESSSCAQPLPTAARAPAVPLRPQAARQERELQAALESAARALATYDQRAEAVRARGGVMPTGAARVRGR